MSVSKNILRAVAVLAVSILVAPVASAAVGLPEQSVSTSLAAEGTARDLSSAGQDQKSLDQVPQSAGETSTSTNTGLALVDPLKPQRVGNRVTIPTEPGVSYTDEEGSPLTGEVRVEIAGLVIKAVALPGFKLNPELGASWLFPFDMNDRVLVDPVKPERSGNKVTIPEIVGLTYLDANGALAVGTVSVPVDGLVLRVLPNPGYKLNPELRASWLFTYDMNDRILVDPIKPDWDGTNVIIPKFPGLIYKDGEGNVLKPGNVVVKSPNLVVIAVPATGYTLNPQLRASWLFAYKAPVPAVEPGTCPVGNLRPVNGVVSFADPASLVEVSIDTLGKSIPASKDDGKLPVCIMIKSDGASYGNYGTIAVQGSSTAYWPKKNWNIRLFSDKERKGKNAVLLKFGDSVASKEWVTKADWIDPTQLRNHLSFNLWADMVQTRTSSPKLEVGNSSVSVPGAQGFPYTYMSRVKINNAHYGISTLMLGHDPNNFNVDPKNPNHAFLTFDGRVGNDPANPGKKSWAKFKSNSAAIENYLDGDFSAAQKAGIDNFSAFINGSQQDFNANFDKYFDKTNMIDSLLFIEVIADWDAVAQDIEIVTYDLQRWYFLPWDKDTTFGMDWDGSGIKENFVTQTIINYSTEDPEQRPWFKTYTAYKGDVEARYAQLRRAGVFTVRNLSGIADDAYARIPAQAWKDELALWKPQGRPSINSTDYPQIMNWFGKRLSVLDQQFNYVP